MKKSTKIIMGVIGGLLLTGLFLLMIGVIAGGSYQAREIIIDEGHIDSSFNEWLRKLIGINPLGDIGGDFGDSDYGDDNQSEDVHDSYNEDFEDIHDDHDSSESSHDGNTGHDGNMTGSVNGTLTEIGRADSTDALIFELAAGKFTLQKSDDDGIYISYTKGLDVEYSDKDGTLYVEAADKRSSKGFLSWIINRSDAAAMTVYLPEKVYKDVEISLSAGTLVMQEALTADTLKIETNAGVINGGVCSGAELFIEVNAGEVEIRRTESERTEVAINAGECEISDALFNELVINAAMGSVDVCVDGKETETSYKAECGMGDIQIGRDSCSGMDSRKQQDRGDNEKRYITAECDMGEIEISFSER